MAAALCIGQAAGAAMPSAGYEYRPDAAGGAASGKCGCGGGEKVPVNVASKGFFWPPCITRFPPNFVRQSSIKARRNCSNIGVAQVVAASATDRNTPVAVAAAAAAALTSAPAEVVDGPLELAENGSAVVSAGVNETLIGSAISLPRGDAAEAEKPDRKKSSTLAVHGGEQIWLLP
jgi:cystathionine gamma-synthase